MGGALVARLAWSITTMLLCLTALHAVHHVLPGDPVRTLFGFQAPAPELLAELHAAYGLDDPYLVQLGRYLAGLATGELGPVYRLSPTGLSPSGETVSGLIRSSVPATMRMVVLAVVLHTLVGTALGVALSGTSPRRVLAARAVVALLIAVPSFLLAGLAQLWAPGLVDALGLLAASAFLAATPTGMLALVGQPLFRDATRAPHVRRALAGGISPRRARWVHGLRPTAGPLLVLGAAEAGNLLAAAVLVEPVLGRAGLGSVLVEAMRARQGPTILGVVGTTFILVTALNLAADLATMRLDPRVRAL